MTTSKYQFKAQVESLQSLINMQKFVLDSASTIINDIYSEMKKKDILEEKMSEFDKSLKEKVNPNAKVYTQVKDGDKKRIYKSDDLYIETRWL